MSQIRLRAALLACVLVVAVGYVAAPIGMLAFNHFVAAALIVGNEATLPIDPFDDPPLPIIAPAGEYHKALTMVMDYPGVNKPDFHTVKTAMITHDTSIIGIVVGEQAYAFPICFLSDPKNHVLNFVLDEKPISVTYCNMVDCARVLTRDVPGRIPLRNGGLDVDDQMVLKIDGVRYGQTSKNLPLEDYECVRTALTDWVKLHPKTLIYDITRRDPPKSKEPQRLKS